MLINEKTLAKIIGNEFRRLIFEKLSSRIFHFCPLSACYNIVMSNSLVLSSVNQNNNDKRMNTLQTGKDTYKTYPYYMCFSRTFSTSDGYVRTRRENTPDWRKATVRIEFDGDLLNRFYYGKPVNAFLDPNSDKLNKSGTYYSIPKEPGLLTKKEFSNPSSDLGISMSYEHEDRLLSDKKVIEKADSFIKEIDILLKYDVFDHPEKYEDVMSMLGKMLRNHSFGKKIQIYNNEKAFNSLNVRDSVSLENFFQSSNKKKRNSLETNYDYVRLNSFKKKYSDYLRKNPKDTMKLPSGIFKKLAEIFSVIAYNKKNYIGGYVNDAITLIKKCGLKKYIDDIVDKMPKLEEWGINRFVMVSQMYNGTMIQLRTIMPDAEEKIQELKREEEEEMGVGLFYGKGVLHKKIYGF